MDIDWKYVANTVGYKSLKAAYVSDVTERRKSRSKAEYLRKFNWVIARAKHYAYHTNTAIEVVLYNWESKRTYWWLNYYQDCNQPKLISNSKIPMGLAGTRKYYSTYCYSKELKARRVLDYIMREQEKNSSKVKKRWPMSRKKRYR